MRYGKGASLTAILAARVAAAADRPPPRLEADDYDSMTKAELVRLAADRGVPADGTKADLVARLAGDDA